MAGTTRAVPDSSANHSSADCIVVNSYIQWCFIDSMVLLKMVNETDLAPFQGLRIAWAQDKYFGLYMRVRKSDADMKNNFSLVFHTFHMIIT